MLRRPMLGCPKGPTRIEDNHSLAVLQSQFPPHGIGRAIGRPVPFEEAPRRPGDPPLLVADASRFMRELDWRPRYSDLDTIVRTAWAWLRSWKRI